LTAGRDELPGPSVRVKPSAPSGVATEGFSVAAATDGLASGGSFAGGAALSATDRPPLSRGEAFPPVGRAAESPQPAKRPIKTNKQIRLGKALRIRDIVFISG
jgi:hypothetical protein